MFSNIKVYYPLGDRTLFMLILKRSFVFFLLLPLLFTAIFFATYVPSAYVDLAINLIFLYVIILIFISAGLVFLGWLEYWRYQIFLDDKDIRLQRGMISVEEVGLPYRRVRDLKIERSLIAQLIGVSDVQIVIVGGDENATHAEQSTLVLPALPREVALQIQDIVLKKVQVEDINVVGGGAHP